MVTGSRDKLVDEDEHQDLDGYYEDVNEKADRDGDWLFMVAALLGGVFVLESLKPAGPRDRPILAGIPTPVNDISDETFSTLMKSEINPMKLDSSLESLSYIYSDAELEQYKQLGEELKQYGRIEDPRSVENTAMRWAENRNDMMGMFGDLEAYKSGVLDQYILAMADYDVKIQIPWNPTGPNTCDYCMQLVDRGPYSPEEFPEPPHFGCQCNDPMADPIITFPYERIRGY